MSASKYGSEYHLLRFLGRHRNHFNTIIFEKTKISNIQWLDFTFSQSKSLDNELKGLDFLTGIPFIKNDQAILKQFRDSWPSGKGSVMNWDAVGYTAENELILVEAKAHIGELHSCCRAGKQSKNLIISSLHDVAKNVPASSPDKQPWTEKYYQMANRLYIMDLLQRNGVKAKLLNIYFLGDLRSNNRKSPKTEREWTPHLNDIDKYLGINTKYKEEKFIYTLFLDVKG